MIGLNKGEHVNAVQKVLFFGRRGEFWDRKCEDQCNRISYALAKGEYEAKTVTIQSR